VSSRLVGHFNPGAVSHCLRTNHGEQVTQIDASTRTANSTFCHVVRIHKVASRLRSGQPTEVGR
jgi:hypothetical protein